jgi:hypothetical protein
MIVQPTRKFIKIFTSFKHSSSTGSTQILFSLDGRQAFGQSAWPQNVVNAKQGNDKGYDIE